MKICQQWKYLLRILLEGIIGGVTFNEPYFSGDFPGRPLMPGVLQIEAMAQVGGSVDFQELRELLSAIAKTDITEFTLKSDDFELTLRKDSV